MAGNHRAERPHEGSRVSARAVTVAVVLALLPALWFGGKSLLDGSDSDSPGRTAAPTTTPIPVDPTAVPTANPSITPAAPVTAVPDLPKVAADVPRRLTVPGLLDVGFDDSIEPKGGAFTAGSTAEAARWGSRGLPASPSTDTVYLVGKVYRQGASAFDDLPKLKNGSRITLRTDAGRLTYTVTSASDQPASGLTDDVGFAAKVPGRLVLVGIRYDAQDDERTGQVLVVTAQLSGATKA